MSPFVAQRFRLILSQLRLAVPLLLLLFAVSGCGPQGEAATVLRLAHGMPADHPVNKAMEVMGDRLRELSGATMQIEIYPNGQLGSERDLLELLQIGSLAMTKVSASPLESFVPAYKIFSIPYVFRDHQHFWRMLESPLGRELLLSSEPARLRGLGFYDAGSRSFYASKPIRSPEDLEGMKIRVQKSMTSVEMVKRLGGAATPIAWGELYTALQQGVVDGAENNIPSFYLSKHYEVSPYLSLDEHTYVPDVLLIGLPTWNSLTPQQQAWLQQAADDSITYQRQLWEQKTQQSLEALQANGIKVITPDKEPFRQRVLPMHQAYNNTPMGDLMDAIKTLP
ncbi:TRAP transporter substrate-binding protein [Aestuariicella hydrocarbonica]|uniref:TRAP transporter substrate-binding protein n=1 Tax=Pseudomaricurvus hydrocarbonicus TaxID=1470433 RepID=A0A9E5T4M6_9GAMM|nr:TRAP transporter substrate-binding protein [Aestuariicella hydrocarbonica]NHO68268.1 TRAP transporter substrate-binding protein [Aestuariicella hydrocarbonica]